MSEGLRRLLDTGRGLRFVRLAIPPGGDTGEETDDHRDRFVRIEGGEGEIWIDGACHRVKAHDGMIVPRGARHNVVSRGTEPLRLYTIHGPPERVDGIVHRTRADADAASERSDGRTAG